MKEEEKEKKKKRWVNLLREIQYSLVYGAEQDGPQPRVFEYLLDAGMAVWIQRQALSLSLSSSSLDAYTEQ